jgi:uncharacterized membrane protein HdeD (DUF308 family)
LILLYHIAAWAIVTGVIEIAAAFSGGLLVAQEWTLALAGVLSMLLGILLIVRSDVVLLSLIWLIGAYAIVFGVILIILAIQFRTAVSHPQAWR